MAQEHGDQMDESIPGPSQPSASSRMAFQNFELNNDIIPLSSSSLDSIFRFDNEEQRSIIRTQAWKSDPHFFQKVRISAVALIKMVMHARSGGIYEIMGLMQGKIDPVNRTIYIMDSFALPVEGTETRVNAQNEAYEFMVQYLDHSKEIGRLENVVGWYHSHPGYGCWLSGIDVNTQRTNQTFQDPFVALVIDPNRTISSGKVDIGAFRTLPESYVEAQQKKQESSSSNQASSGGGGGGGSSSEFQSIPLNKIEDFGVHANQYYKLEIEHFKSTLDEKLLGLLWNKYWQNTLSQSALVVNKAYTTEQVVDLVGKLKRVDCSSNTHHVQGAGPGGGAAGGADIGAGGGGRMGRKPMTKGSGSKVGAGSTTTSPEGGEAKNDDSNPTTSTERGGETGGASEPMEMVQEFNQKDKASPLNTIVHTAKTISGELSAGILVQNLKSTLFHHHHQNHNHPQQQTQQKQQ